MADHIHIILTGGTIEKAYDPITEKPEFKNDSIVPAYLRDVVKISADISAQVICQIDSLEMKDSIRADILSAIEHTPSRHIVIVHGTSTMAQTAEYIKTHLKRFDKTIILTGAMIPMKEFAMSDGGFNLGYAVAQVLNNPAGIYVCMNARTFAAGTVQKDTQAGRFESLS